MKPQAETNASTFLEAKSNWTFDCQAVPAMMEIELWYGYDHVTADRSRRMNCEVFMVVFSIRFGKMLLN